MKRAFVLVFCALVGVGAYAQEKGDVAAGVNVSYGSEISNVGFGVEGQYSITNEIRAELGFDYFLEKDNLKMWDLNLNVQYLFPLGDKFILYPFVGLTYTNWTASWDLGDWLDDEYYEYCEDWYDDDDESGDESEGKFGVNIGCGIQYDLSSKLVLSAELKYQIISDFDQFVVGVGLAYKF